MGFTGMGMAGINGWMGAEDSGLSPFTAAQLNGDMLGGGEGSGGVNGGDSGGSGGRQELDFFSF